MLLRRCLIHLSIIILRYVLYLLYLCPRLDIGLSYLCDLFFIFIFIFNMINRINTDTLGLLLIFQNMTYYFWMIKWMNNVNIFKYQKFSLRVLLNICLFFANFSLALLIKVSIKKAYTSTSTQVSNRDGVVLETYLHHKFQ